MERKQKAKSIHLSFSVCQVHYFISYNNDTIISPILDGKTEI